MTLADYCESLHVEVTDDVVLASSYLQAKGLRFAVDFDTDNAWQIAERTYKEAEAAKK